MIPSPPCEVGRTRVSHLTLALALVAFPLQIKFLTTPQTWQHILGFGFQDAAMYHMEVRSTWFATRILPASERRQVLQLISLPLRADNILLKLASGGRWNPTWIPRYLTPLPSGIHWSPTSWPHSHSLFFCWPRSRSFCANLFLLPTLYKRCPGLFMSFPYCRAFLAGRARCCPQKSGLLFSLLPGGPDLLLRNGGHRACAQGHPLPE